MLSVSLFLFTIIIDLFSSFAGTQPIIVQRLLLSWFESVFSGHDAIPTAVKSATLRSKAQNLTHFTSRYGCVKQTLVRIVLST